MSSLLDRSMVLGDELGVYPCAVAWSPAGTALAVAGDDGTVQLLAPAGMRTHRIAAHEGPVQSVAWRPRSDELLTTGQDGAARLWSPPYEQPTTLVESGTDWAEHACWSPDGKQAAVAIGRRAAVVTPGRKTVFTDAVESTIGGMAFSPSGKSLGIACYGGVRLYDPASGKRTRRLDWKGSMLSLAFSPNGSIVAGGCQDNSVHFWRIASGKDAQMSGYPAKPSAVAFTHDGKWLATSGDAAISLWPFDKRGPEGRAPLQLDGHGDIVTALACAPQLDLLLSGDRSGMVALWAPPDRTEHVTAARLSGKVVGVGWGADRAVGTLRWAAADEHGRVLIGAL